MEKKTQTKDTKKKGNLKDLFNEIESEKKKQSKKQRSGG